MFLRGMRANLKFEDGSQYQVIVETTKKDLSTALLTQWIAAQGSTIALPTMAMVGFALDGSEHTSTIDGINVHALHKGGPVRALAEIAPPEPEPEPEPEPIPEPIPEPVVTTAPAAADPALYLVTRTQPAAPAAAEDVEEDEDEDGGDEEAEAEEEAEDDDDWDDDDDDDDW